MSKTYRCLQCGWEKETTEDLDMECPICQSDLQVDITDIESEEITSLLEEEEIEQMKIKIKLTGNEHIWDCVEHIKNPYARIEERKLFLQAGGGVPFMRLEKLF